MLDSTLDCLCLIETLVSIAEITSLTLFMLQLHRLFCVLPGSRIQGQVLFQNDLQTLSTLHHNRQGEPLTHLYGHKQPSVGSGQENTNSAA